jgi:hypothetical protein
VSGAIEWARPLWGWSLILPLVLLVWLRLSHRPPSVVTGTLKLWKQVAEHSPRSARVVQRGTPPWVWFCAAALLFGILGLMGPRLHKETPPRRFAVVVDPSPSMDLAYLEQAGYASGGEPTRRDRALERASAWLEANASDRDRVRWVLFGEDPVELSAGIVPESVQRSRRLAKTPDWTLFDQPGTLFVTDRKPTGALESAGFAASGGEAVFGTIAVEGRERIDWYAEGWRTIPDGAPARAVVLESSFDPVPEVLERIVAVWADTRGIAHPGQGDAEVVLRLRFESGRGGGEFDVQRDGWRARVRGGALEPGAGAEEMNWLAVRDADGAALFSLVRAAPGVIRLAIESMEEPTGDPAHFALSWGRLFDRWCLPPAGVVALQEREAAGPASFREPAPALPLEADESSGRPADAEDLDAWLAGFAAILALFALSLRRSQAR